MDQSTEAAEQLKLGKHLIWHRQFAEAIAPLQRAVELQPDLVSGWISLGIALVREDRIDEAISAWRRALDLRPNHPYALYYLELAQRELAIAHRPPPVDKPDKWFSVIVIGYGDFPQYTVRCLESMFADDETTKLCEVHLGLNTAGEKTKLAARRFYDEGKITTLLESNRNLKKDPPLRALLGLTQTPYVLVCDDDSYFKPGWASALVEFLERHHPFEVAGDIWAVDRSPDYQQMVAQRPWWRGVDVGHPAYREKVFFATGALFLARLEFLRKHNYPDRAVLRWREDAMLADLCNQQGGTLLRFTKNVSDRVIVDAGHTRGEDVEKVLPTRPEDFQSGF